VPVNRSDMLARLDHLLTLFVTCALLNYYSYVSLLNTFTINLLIRGLPGRPLNNGTCMDFMECLYFECEGKKNTFNFTGSTCGFSKNEYYKRSGDLYVSIRNHLNMCSIAVFFYITASVILAIAYSVSSKAGIKLSVPAYSCCMILLELVTRFLLISVQIRISIDVPYLPNFITDEQYVAFYGMLVVGLVATILVVANALVISVSVHDPDTVMFETLSMAKGEADIRRMSGSLDAVTETESDNNTQW